ncbi:hypothetical protein M3Y94_00004500 [Aphelenchoides besseyi]|nr:hypothetical protein M3Y94_00004500 [Aphelenchoides besseyi]
MLLILFLLPAVLGINVNPRKLTGKQLVDYVNRNAKWRATTRRIDTNATNLLAGVKLDFPRVFASDQRQKAENLREENPTQHSTSTLVRRSSLCGSCWAVSSASSLQDRFCIWSRGSIQPDLSAIDLVSCCTECGEGCTGGYPHRVFEYAEKQGIVSGGNFTNSNGCKPYPFANCQNGHGDFSGPQCKGGNKEDVCIRTCQPAFSYNYYTDRYFTSGSVVIQNDATAIQQELFRSGPLVFGAMQIFEDFLHYRSGVYELISLREHSLSPVTPRFDANGPDMNAYRRTILITGATDGIGRQVALELATRSDNFLIIHGRTQKNCERLLQDIAIEQKILAPSNCGFVVADFTDFQQVVRMADEIKQNYRKLNVFIGCASVLAKRKLTTKNGLESQFQINHLAHFTLLNLLLPILEQNVPSRILTVGSMLHALNPIDWTDVNCDRIYDNSTNLSASYPNLCSHSGAVHTLVRLAESPEFASVSGKYYNAVGKEIASAPEVMDIRIQERLWQMSSDYCRELGIEL